MNSNLRLAVAGLVALSAVSIALAQGVIENRLDNWNSMWLGQNNVGMLGEATDQCPPYRWSPGCEMPPGSRVQYLSWTSLWIGALIDSGGVRTPRVSVATDGWLNPNVTEFWPGEDDTVIERSRFDTVNCLGEPLYDPTALSDHEFEMGFSDTFTDETWVIDDPIDGPHRPLGIHVTRTVYSTMVLPCSYIYWVKYHVQNIGQNRLRDVYLGHLVEAGVGHILAPTEPNDDLAGFEPTREIAYIVDNDGRREVDTVGTDISAPHIAGLMYLRTPGDGTHLSFNWWVEDWEPEYDFGPSWVDSPEWTRALGTPMGDERKYAIMSNREMDYDQVRMNDPAWIASHPQGEHAWRVPDHPHSADVANGFFARALFSVGPFGHEEGYYRVLNPGESFDCWMAIVGGRYFHNPVNPQPSDTIIDPSLFRYDDLYYHADIVRNSLCVEWLTTPGSEPLIPASFRLGPVWPNPFNASAHIKLMCDRTMPVEVVAYDVLGRMADHIASRVFPAGTSVVSWNAEGLPSGVYMIQARSGEQRAVQKALLLK